MGLRSQAYLQESVPGKKVETSEHSGCCEVLPFREEYLVCDFPCILSTCGGYVGLFFGVSIFDIIFLLEWLIFYHRKL